MTVIELHIPDFEKAKAFYQKLGFKVVWERTPEGFKGYLVMKMQDNLICFWGGNLDIYKHPYFQKWPQESKRGYGVELVLTVTDLENYYNNVKSFANVVENLQEKPWGLHDFRIEDPFGFYLRFTEPHDITDPKFAVK